MQPRSRSPGRAYLFAIALFLLALAVIVVRTQPLPTLGGVRLSMAWLMDDFKIIIYCPAHLLLHGGNPYDRAQFLAFCPVDEGMPMYLPSAFFLHALFGVLPLTVSAVTYLGLSILLTVLLAFAAYRLSDLPVTLTQVILVAALMLLSRPGQWNVLLGQPALELVLACYIALHYAHQRPWLSGLALAISVFKPTFGLPLMVLMLARGDRRAVVAGAAVAAALNLPLIAMLAGRAGGLKVLVDQVLAGQRDWQAKVNPADSGAAVDLAAVLGRFIGEPLSTAGWVLVALIVLGVTALALRRIGNNPDVALARLSNSLICIATLVAVHHFAYDLLLLAAPVVVLTSQGLPRGFLSRRRVVVLYVLYGVLGANYLGSTAVLSRLEEQPGLWLLIASLNGVSLLGIFLIYLSRTLSRREGRIKVAIRPEAQLAQG